MSFKESIFQIATGKFLRKNTLTGLSKTCG